MRRQIVSFLPVLTAVSTALAQANGPSPSPQVTGQAAAANSQIILNEVNPSRFSLVEIFATVLKDGEPQKGLTAGDFRVREDEVDQGPLKVEGKLPPLSVVILLDNSGSMKPRMKETLSFLTPNPEELKTLYDRIGEQLAGQYLITYNSNLPGDGSPHQVQVQYGELASSKEYQVPQLTQSSSFAKASKDTSSTAATIAAATPDPKSAVTPETIKQESTAVTIDGLNDLLKSAGIRVNKDGKEFQVRTDGISVRDSNPNSLPASSSKQSDGQKPDWIPIPDGGSITSQTVIGDDTGRVVLVVRRPESEIRGFYRAQFAQKGWSVTELSNGGSSTVIATGDSKRVQIAVTEQSSGDTLVAINYNAN